MKCKFYYLSMYSLWSTFQINEEQRVPRTHHFPGRFIVGLQKHSKSLFVAQSSLPTKMIVTTEKATGPMAFAPSKEVEHFNFAFQLFGNVELYRSRE